MVSCFLSGMNTHGVFYRNSFPFSPWCNGLQSLFQRSVHVKALKVFGHAQESIDNVICILKACNIFTCTVILNISLCKIPGVIKSIIYKYTLTYKIHLFSQNALP